MHKPLNDEEVALRIEEELPVELSTRLGIETGSVSVSRDEEHGYVLTVDTPNGDSDITPAVEESLTNLCLLGNKMQ